MSARVWHLAENSNLIDTQLNCRSQCILTLTTNTIIRQPSWVVVLSLFASHTNGNLSHVYYPSHVTWTQHKALLHSYPNPFVTLHLNITITVRICAAFSLLEIGHRILLLLEIISNKLHISINTTDFHYLSLLARLQNSSGIVFTPLYHSLLDDKQAYQNCLLNSQSRKDKGPQMI